MRALAVLRAWDSHGSATPHPTLIAFSHTMWGMMITTGTGLEPLAEPKKGQLRGIDCP